MLEATDRTASKLARLILNHLKGSDMLGPLNCKTQQTLTVTEHLQLLNRQHVEWLNFRVHSASCQGKNSGSRAIVSNTFNVKTQLRQNVKLVHSAAQCLHIVSECSKTHQCVHVPVGSDS